MTTAPPTSPPAGGLKQVRARLAEPAPRRGSAWAMLGAAGFAAASGLALCVAVFASAADLPSVRPPPTPSVFALSAVRG